MRTNAVGFMLWAAVLVALAPFSGAQEKATGSKGQLLFNNACRTCHTLKEGDNRLGPNLNRIIGRKAGALKDYGYSSAMKSGDLIWDKPTLDRFIANPDQVVPGHTMQPYGGLASPEERASIIDYLEEGASVLAPQ
jgi:cytochrome c